MFGKQKKLKEIEDRISRLERGAVADTYHYGAVDLKKLARIIDGKIPPKEGKTASGN